MKLLFHQRAAELRPRYSCARSAPLRTQLSCNCHRQGASIADVSNAQLQRAPHSSDSSHDSFHVESQADADDVPFLSFAGGGIYFFWQLGAVKYLREQYDLTQVPMAGASSGSLVACLAACGVDPKVIFDAAYRLAEENDIWNRRFGLLGIWGGLIRAWLDELLPDNAHELVNGRLHVIIAKAPTLQLFEVNTFESKEDLIESVMASAHVPFFIDGRPFLRYRGRLCWDGSFPDFVFFENSALLKRGGKAFIVDYALDEDLEWQRGDFLRLRPHDEILELMEKGYNHVKRLHDRGVLGDHKDASGYVLP